MGSAQRSMTKASSRTQRFLHSKGFVEGVPPNTETAAVKPRAGIESIARRCLILVEMAGAGSRHVPGPITFAVVI